MISKPKAVTIVFILSLSFLGLKPTSAAPPQAFLQINQFYVLYTNPIVPYLAKDTDFMVGLQAIALMLNAKTFSIPQATITTLVKGSHKIKFTAGSRTVLIDDKPAVMPLPAELKQPSKQMVVPMSVLIKAFHLQSHWNSKRRVFTVTGKDLMHNIDNELLSYVDLERSDHDPTALVPLSAVLAGPKKDQQQHRLDFQVQNATGKELKKGVAFINVLSAGELPQRLGEINGPYVLNYSLGGIPWPPDLATPSPALKPGEKWLSDLEVSGPASPKTIYLAAWLVVSKFSIAH